LSAQPQPHPITAAAAVPPRLPEVPAHIIGSDAEAIELAHRLAAEFAREAAERDRERRLPFAEIEAFSQSGLWSLNVPKVYGGPEASYATVAEVFAIISAADPSIGQIPQSHISLIDLIRFKPEEKERRALYDLALRGVRFGNAVSETGGKNVKDWKTTLTPTVGGFTVTGRKFYATGALFAHVVPLAALDANRKGHLAFIDRDTPGLTIIDDWSGFGQKTTASGTVVLDNVFVPAARVVPTHLAYDTPSVHGPVSQIIHAGIDLGIARAAIADTLDYVRGKSRPWIDSRLERASDDPYIIRDIGDLQIRLHAAEALLARAGRIIDESLKDETAESVAAASIATAEARVLTNDAALLATSKLFELGGAGATQAKYNLDRHWRNARTHTLHDPVRWKYHAIGNYALNSVKPPRHLWS
jgi:SfnB family sulfur acquisition oxidoreductase